MLYVVCFWNFVRYSGEGFT